MSKEDLPNSAEFEGVKDEAFRQYMEGVVSTLVPTDQDGYFLVARSLIPHADSFEGEVTVGTGSKLSARLGTLKKASQIYQDQDGMIDNTRAKIADRDNMITAAAFLYARKYVKAESEITNIPVHESLAKASELLSGYPLANSIAEEAKRLRLITEKRHNPGEHHGTDGDDGIEMSLGMVVDLTPKYKSIAERIPIVNSKRLGTSGRKELVAAYRKTKRRMDDKGCIQGMDHGDAWNYVMSEAEISAISFISAVDRHVIATYDPVRADSYGPINFLKDIRQVYKVIKRLEDKFNTPVLLNDIFNSRVKAVIRYCVENSDPSSQQAS